MDKVLERILGSTDSVVIVFIIVVILAFVLVGIPIYNMASKQATIKRESYFRREQLLVEVVKDNSSVISKLTGLIEKNNQNCHECKAEQIGMMTAIGAKQDSILNKVETTLAVVQMERRKID